MVKGKACILGNYYIIAYKAFCFVTPLSSHTFFCYSFSQIIRYPLGIHTRIIDIFYFQRSLYSGSVVDA